MGIDTLCTGNMDIVPVTEETVAWACSTIVVATDFFAMYLHSRSCNFAAQVARDDDID